MELHDWLFDKEKGEKKKTRVAGNLVQSESF